MAQDCPNGPKGCPHVTGEIRRLTNITNARTHPLPGRDSISLYKLHDHQNEIENTGHFVEADTLIVDFMAAKDNAINLIGGIIVNSLTSDINSKQFSADGESDNIITSLLPLLARAGISWPTSQEQSNIPHKTDV